MFPALGIQCFEPLALFFQGHRHAARVLLPRRLRVAHLEVVGVIAGVGGRQIAVERELLAAALPPRPRQQAVRLLGELDRGVELAGGGEQLGEVEERPGGGPAAREVALGQTDEQLAGLFLAVLLAERLGAQADERSRRAVDVGDQGLGQRQQLAPAVLLGQGAARHLGDPQPAGRQGLPGATPLVSDGRSARAFSSACRLEVLASSTAVPSARARRPRHGQLGAAEGEVRRLAAAGELRARAAAAAAGAPLGVAAAPRDRRT